MSATIPGTVAKTLMVTDRCRINGDEQALRAAADALYAEAVEIITLWRGIYGLELHFTLTVDRQKSALVLE